MEEITKAQLSVGLKPGSPEADITRALHTGERAGFLGASSTVTVAPQWRSEASTATKGLAFNTDTSATQKSFDGSMTLATGASITLGQLIGVKPPAAPPPAQPV